MKAIVILKNFENEIKITCSSQNWNDLEDRVCEVEDNVNNGRPLFERYKSVETKYYDNEGFEYDIYLKERV